MTMPHRLQKGGTSCRRKSACIVEMLSSQRRLSRLSCCFASPWICHISRRRCRRDKSSGTQEIGDSPRTAHHPASSRGCTSRLRTRKEVLGQHHKLVHADGSHQG